MGVTSPNQGHHALINGTGGNNIISTRVEQNVGIEHRPSERNLCKCCPYGYHIDVDFVRFCEALTGSEGWGDTGKRIRRSRRRQRQSMEGLLGLTGPSVWLMEHHLPKIPQEWPATAVAPDPAGASAMVKDALQQAVLDFEDTLKRSSHKGILKDQRGIISIDGKRHQKEVLHIAYAPAPASPSYISSTPSQLPVHPNSTSRRERDSASSTSSLISTTSSIMNHVPASTGPLHVSTSMSSTQEIVHESCNKILTTCTSDTNLHGQSSVYHQHDSDGGSVGSNASGGLSTEALQNIREQMALSLEKMKEMEEKLKLIPILQVQLSILKEEKRKMLLQLKQKQSGINYHEVKSLTNDSTQTTQTDYLQEKRDAGVCCSVLTREVGTCSQQLRLRDVSTNTIIPQENKKTNCKPLVLSPVVTESIPSESPKKVMHTFSMTELSGRTWCFDAEHPLVVKHRSRSPEKRSKELKEASTATDEPLEPAQDEFSSKYHFESFESPVMKPLVIIEKRDFDCQTVLEDESDESKKELVTRDVQVQANLQRSISISREVQTYKSKLSHMQTQTQGRVTRDMSVTAKPISREASIFAKPTVRDFSGSCSLSIEKDSMSVSLLTLGVKSTQESGNTSISKATDTAGLIVSSDVAVSVSISDPQVTKVKPEETSVYPIISVEAASEEMVEDESHACREEIVVKTNGTEELECTRRKTLLRQDTYTECKTEVQSSTTVEVTSDNERLSSQNLTDTSKCYLEMRRPSLSSDTEAYGGASYEGMVTEDESLHQYMITENSSYHYTSRNTNREKASPSKEMKAAIKVVNDLLQKHPRSNLKSQLKSATGVIQQEWFTISSTAMANPLDVEDYLDYFEEVSVALLEYIVNLPDNTGNTAMHYAVSHGNFDVVSILLDSKVCDIRRANQAGYTCVMLVSLAEVRSETDRQVVRRLFQMADVNMRAKQHGQTALMLSVSHGRLDMVQLLLEAGADVNIQDEDGSTALMCAAEHGHADIVRALLAQPDCDASIEDNDGSTALNIAMEAGHRNIGVLLYAHEHFQPASPHGSLKQWRTSKHSSSQASTPTPAETSS